ncbi:AAA family ATPase [Rathayibacter sp. AY1C1]|jgi:SpoVK/Ycf46/Vps4 family AAA+-type ATPase|uniref:AAA family ATPase n=1 Tax=Rathayibacter sp. AY1C1 TaxID=2080534 RepID=UPI000CE85850|nr:ATP-binding protein [Rathayibacter sp. AY1C1]PPH05947.1 AAA family ATPase [Rathayibacter sp. AY1C1]
MAAKTRTNYQHEGGLQDALIDLVRVGMAGYGPGVRQIASRLLRSLPPEVHESEEFRGMLREVLSAASPAHALRFAPGEVPQDAETNTLVDVDPNPSGAALVLAPAAMSELEEIVAERERSDELERAGITPTRALLLSGEPGVGKTLAARWLAEKIGVPLVSLDLASVVSSYLGSSGRNIKSVLEYAQSGPCVLLLDEFDAVAKRRDDDTDVGELKRIVNVLLVELDKWSSTSLLVAATNHPQLLDPAINRRFDRSIELQVPTLRERKIILQNLANGSASSKVIDVMAEVTTDETGSGLSRLWGTILRRSVLHGTPVDDEVIRAALVKNPESGKSRDLAWHIASQDLNLSARQIAQLAGVTHPTVTAALRRIKGSENG